MAEGTPFASGAERLPGSRRAGSRRGAGRGAKMAASWRGEELGVGSRRPRGVSEVARERGSVGSVPPGAGKAELRAQLAGVVNR